MLSISHLTLLPDHTLLPPPDHTLLSHRHNKSCYSRSNSKVSWFLLQSNLQVAHFCLITWGAVLTSFSLLLLSYHTLPPSSRASPFCLEGISVENLQSVQHLNISSCFSKQPAECAAPKHQLLLQ